MLIGLHGKPRVGKDTLAAHLIKKFSLLRYGPSVRVKMTTAAMFDFPVEYLDDDNMKDQMDPFWGMTYRQMAQKVGKESSRDVFGDDIWMRHVEKKLKELGTVIDGIPVGQMMYHAKGLILADVRYESEINWIKNYGGDVIFIIRNNAPKSSDTGHIVDAGLPTDLADILINNDGTKEELYANADRQMASYYSWEESENL